MQTIPVPETSEAPFAWRRLEEMILPEGLELLPGVRQKYELELALAEVSVLSRADLVRRSAYLATVDGQPTFHRLVCENVPSQVNPDASPSRKKFFDVNRFSVGYATHGLFPYRGKFHPQMIKALLNVMRLKTGDTVVDPMMGSGTTVVEASLMGLRGLGIDTNPFTVLMSQAKLDGLRLPIFESKRFLQAWPSLFRYFEAEHQAPPQGQVTLRSYDEKPLAASRGAVEAPAGLATVLLLCYLDTLAYASRRKRKTAKDLFPEMLGRYLEAVLAFVKIRDKIGLELGPSRVTVGDARNLPVDDDSADGILFSPPYSFALDYLDNDRAQLEYLGHDLSGLRERMVGLRGSKEDKLATYFEDMRLVLRECRRIAKPGAYCTIVIGSNTNQTGGVSLEDGLAGIAKEAGLDLVRHMSREIEGIRNTMLEEHVIFLQRPLH